MVKSSCSGNTGLRKGAWSPEEDKKLIAYVNRYGHWNWNLLPKFAGLERSGKSCRLRWLNYLRPNIKRGNYTQEEDETIIKLHQRLGNRWSAIAAELPGRTDNQIKNYWHTYLKKRYQHNSETCGKAQISHSRDQSPVEEMATTAIDIAPFQSLPSTCQSTDSSTSEFSITPDHIHSIADSNQYLVPENEFAFLDAYQEDPLNGSFWLESNLADISTVPWEILAAEPHCFSPVGDVQLWTHDGHYGA